VYGIAPAEFELAGRRLFDQRDHARERGLAAPRFADDGKRAPGFHGKRQAAHGGEVRGLAQPSAAHLVHAAQTARADDGRVAFAHAVTTAPARSRAMASSRPGSPNG
jgi:hypothetical protein